SAAYMARYIAKNLVAAELARTCEVQVAYAIGVADPVSVAVNTFGTAAIPEDHIARIVREHFDLKPAGIIETLRLKRPIYRRTASYGHFGRVPDCHYFRWERTEHVAHLLVASDMSRRPRRCALRLQPALHAGRRGGGPRPPREDPRVRGARRGPEAVLRSPARGPRPPPAGDARRRRRPGDAAPHGARRAGRRGHGEH